MLIKPPLEAELARRGARLKRIGRHNWEGACLKCGGCNRFGMNTKKQIWNCRGCHKGGDVIALVQHLDEVGFAQAVETLTGQRPMQVRVIAAPQLPREADEDERKKTAQAREWFGEASQCRDTPVYEYLASRSLKPALSIDTFRYHPSCPWRDGKLVHIPVWLAAFRSIETDEIMAVHRIRLDQPARWPKTERKMYGPVRGTAIKIGQPKSELVIGEGVETCLAAQKLHGFPAVWALGSVGAIERFPVVEGVRVLRILCEAGPASVRPVAQCLERWARAGRLVRVIWPKRGCSDINDELMGMNVA